MVILSNLGRVEDCTDRDMLNGERNQLLIKRDDENGIYEESSGSDPTETSTMSISTQPPRRKEAKDNSKNALSWKYFTVDFHSTVGPVKMHQLAELEQAC